jgi:hypothetical protein
MINSPENSKVLPEKGREQASALAFVSLGNASKN